MYFKAYKSLLPALCIILLSGCQTTTTTQNTNNTTTKVDTTNHTDTNNNNDIKDDNTNIQTESNNPNSIPKASLTFSYRDVMNNEVAVAMLSLSEDIEDLYSSDIDIQGATLISLQKVTPKLYRIIFKADTQSTQVRLHISKNAIVDKDGYTLNSDIDKTASIATAPWAEHIRRYRGIIDATFVYQNPQGQSMSLDMIWIRPGTFMMGCASKDEHHCNSDETAHIVELTKGFWLSRTEITQWQWKVVMGNNPSRFASNIEDEQKKLPVEQVSYTDAMRFASKLLNSTQAYATLPTEAQWEYAIRSTTTTAFYDNPDDIKGDANSKAAYYIGWYAGNSSEWTYKKTTQPQPANGIDISDRYKNFYTKPSSTFATHYIMQKANSDWRLKDMAGNVAEWCSDWYNPNLGTNKVTNPTGAKDGTSRVVRGGSWYDPATMLRSASRQKATPDTKSSHIGVRIAIIPGEK